MYELYNLNKSTSDFKAKEELSYSIYFQFDNRMLAYSVSMPIIDYVY